jgi:hypothetical protein
MMNPDSVSGAHSINRLQVLLQSHFIMASNCISTGRRLQGPNSLDFSIPTSSITTSKLARLQSPSLHDPGLPTAFTNSFDYGLQIRILIVSKVHLQTRFITASKCARLRPPSACPKSFDHGLRVHLYVHLITVSKLTQLLPPKLARLWPPKCISKLGQSWPPSSHNHSLQMHLRVDSIVIFRRTSNCSQAPPAGNVVILCLDGYLS